MIIMRTKHETIQVSFEKGLRHNPSKQTLQKMHSQTWSFGPYSFSTPIWFS